MSPAGIIWISSFVNIFNIAIRSTYIITAITIAINVANLSAIIPLRVKYIKYEIPKNYEIQYSTVPLDNPSWMVPKIVTTNKNLNNKKLLMYRDSFATALMPFLSNTFEQVIYRWTHQISKSEIDNADIVIFETVERGLTDILTCKEKL